MISSVSVIFFFYCFLFLFLSLSDTLFGRPVPYKPVLMLVGNLRYDVNLCINVSVEKGWHLFIFSLSWFGGLATAVLSGGKRVAPAIWPKRLMAVEVFLLMLQTFNSLGENVVQED